MGSPIGSCLLGLGAQERGPWARAEHYRQTRPGKGGPWPVYYGALGRLLHLSGPSFLLCAVWIVVVAAVRIK